jgi:Ca2+-binding EF-hand superfamily protein
MDYNQFRKGLGLLGREESFLSRIFYILDQDEDGSLTFEDYMLYLDTIMNGTETQKARFSWMLLTQGKGQLEFEDLVDVFQEISVVWNALTGEIIAPKKKYIEELFNIFDIDQDELITFQE